MSPSNIFLPCRLSVILPALSLLFTLGQCWTGQIVFQEDFNGNSLNSNRWTVEEGCKGYGGNNLECYSGSRSNLQVANGLLTITARIQRTNTNEQGYDYTSGRIRQIGQPFRYGAYVMRARLPDGKHLWPAFWTLWRSDCKYEEIDILEYRGQERSNVVNAGHYGKGWWAVESKDALSGVPFDLSRDFHEFAVLWTPSKLEWYVDNRKYFGVSLEPSQWRRDPNKIPCGDVEQPFGEMTHIILNMAVGGGGFFRNHGNLTVDEARQWRKPTYEVDWIRIYQE